MQGRVLYIQVDAQLFVPMDDYRDAALSEIDTLNRIAASTDVSAVRETPAEMRYKVRHIVAEHLPRVTRRLNGCAP